MDGVKGTPLGQIRGIFDLIVIIEYVKILTGLNKKSQRGRATVASFLLFFLKI